MSKKLHVCIDGLNLGLLKGTGIASYARNLGNHLHRNGVKLSILFDKGLNEASSDLLYEVAFYQAISTMSEKERRPRRSFGAYASIPFYILRSLCYKLRSPRSKERIFPGIVESGELKNRLPAFDGIYNTRGLFRLAKCYFVLFGEFLPVRLSPAPDIMHWTCPIPARVIGAKNYYTVHDIIPLRLPHSTMDNKKYFYDMLACVARSADKIITVSECSKHDFITYFKVSPDKVVNTYQDVSLSDVWSEDKEIFSSNQLRTQFSLEPRQYFLYVGAIEPKKNVLRLLEGFLSANVSQKLVVVGSLAWQSDKEKLMLEQHTDRIIYLNYVSSEVLNTLLRHARALIFPSLFEGFGLPVIEAMSVGTPVITSNTSSLVEIAGDAAYLVNPYNVGEIASAIYRLSKEDALCQTLSEKSNARAAYFSGEAYEKRLSSIYNFS